MIEATEGELVLQRLRTAIFGHVALSDALKAAHLRGATFMPLEGNVGQGLAALGAFHLFRELGLSFEIRASHRVDVEHGRTLVLGGGGRLLEGLYEQPGRLVRSHLEHGGHLLILPSTILGFAHLLERHAGQVTVFARERTTLNRLSETGLKDRVHLCQDLAFAIDPSFFASQRDRRGQGCLTSLRVDSESIAGAEGPDAQEILSGHLWHDEDFCGQVTRLFGDYVSGFETVVTDRLELAVLACMLKRKTVLAANTYHENQSVFDFSLKDIPGMRFVENVTPARPAIDRPATTTIDVAAETAATSRAYRFEWEALRERAAFLQQELDSAQAELAAMQKVKSEWWEPEIRRLSDIVLLRDQSISRLEQGRTAWFEPELKRLTAAVEERDQAIAELTRDRDEWFEPELKRVGDVAESREQAVADLTKARTEWFEPELKRLNDLIAEITLRAQEAEERAAALDRQRVESWEPELRRLTDEFASRSESWAAEADQLSLALEARAAEAEEAKSLREHVGALQDQVATLTDAARLTEGMEAALKTELDTVRCELAQRKSDQLRLAQRARRDLADYGQQLSALRQQIEALRAERTEQSELIQNWFKPEINRLHADAQEHGRREAALLADRESLVEQLADRDAVKAEYFEPELERLRQALQRAEADRRIAVSQSRRALMERTDLDYRTRRALDERQSVIDEQRELIEGWFRPETARLYKSITYVEERRSLADAVAETVQAENVRLRHMLDDQAERLRSLQKGADELQTTLHVIEQSRSFRLLRWYRSMYRMPVLGAVARTARRSARRLIGPRVTS